MKSYTDILHTDLESVRSAISEKNGVRCNLAGTRCIVKWEGATPQAILDLSDVGTIKTQTEAIAYYNDPINGWAEEYEEI